ncbi:hypothetical protein OAG86_01350 [Akkermansiaceae bacterium]|nr:hypothetical protein [Akkermansiaceae bacterium]
MIGAFHLVLDQDPRIVGGILAQDVGSKRSYIFFNRFALQVQANRVSEERQVLLVGQPRSEMLRFGFPDVPKVYFF